MLQEPLGSQVPTSLVQDLLQPLLWAWGRKQGLENPPKIQKNLSKPVGVGVLYKQPSKSS